MANYLGQHFLKNGAVIKKIIAAIDPQPNETILEIGPGHGELTFPLAAACEKVGAKVIAIEKDKNLASALETKIAQSEDGRGARDGGSGTIEVIHADILEFLKGPSQGRVEHTKFLRGEFKIAGNIPYYLTGHLLRSIGELKTKPKLTIVMIQKEVAERISAAPLRMNRLAASLQFWAEPKIIAQVPREDFTPPPEVDSAVIALTTKKVALAATYSEAEIEKYYAAVRMLFAQPRKTILNNLVAGTQTSDADSSAKSNKDEIVAMLTKLNIDSSLRPQDLTIENIIRISSVHK